MLAEAAAVAPMGLEYCRRLQSCLYDPTEEELYEREPLMAFSFYLSGRVNALCGIAEEVIQDLDDGFDSVKIDGKHIQRAETLTWLWILGAYEVVRTMHQANKCFSPKVHALLGVLKQELAAARMPAAKMERRGERVAVTSNRNPSAWHPSARDLFVNDPERDEISARALIRRFDEVICAISRSDVMSDHASQSRD
jgi:hypothetical protein